MMSMRYEDLLSQSSSQGNTVLPSAVCLLDYICIQRSKQVLPIFSCMSTRSPKVSLNRLKIMSATLFVTPICKHMWLAYREYSADLRYMALSNFPVSFIQ